MLQPQTVTRNTGERRGLLARLSRCGPAWWQDHLFLTLFGGFVLLALLPLSLTAHVPSVDGGAHLAQVKTWSLINQTGTLAHQEYVANPGLPPYLTYYGLLRVLHNVVSLEAANRMIVALYVVALPCAFLFLLLVYRRDHRLALLVFPLIYNSLLRWGFYANALALPLLLLCLGLLQRHIEGRSLRVEIALAVCVLTLYFTHVLGALAFAVTGPVILLAQVHRPLTILRKGLFAVPGVAVALLWVVGLSPPTRSADYRIAFVSLENNLAELPLWATDFLHSSIDETLLLVLLATVLLSTNFAQGGGKSRWALSLAVLALLVAYFALPRGVSAPVNHWATNVRFLPPALLLLLAVPQASFRRWRLLLFAPVLCLSCVTFVQLATAFGRYGDDIEDLHRVIDQMQPNRRYLGLMAAREGNRDPLLKGPLFRHIPLLAQARLGGYTPRGFGDATMPVRQRTRTPFTQEDVPDGFSYEAHGRFYDYILSVQPFGKRPPERLPGAEKQFTRVAAAGRFALYARKQ